MVTLGARLPLANAERCATASPAAMTMTQAHRNDAASAVDHFRRNRRNRL